MKQITLQVGRSPKVLRGAKKSRNIAPWQYRDQYLKEVLEELAANPAYIQAKEEGRAEKSCLLLMFEPVCDESWIAKEMALVEEVLPEAQVMLLTTMGKLSAENEVQVETTLSLLIFEKSEVRLFSYDCSDMSAEEAGNAFAMSLSPSERQKGVLMITSDVTLGPEGFIKRVLSSHPEVLFFGTQAGTEDILLDRSLTASKKGILKRGIICGEILSDCMEYMPVYNLGWKALGKKLTVTGSRKNGLLDEVDHKPALDVYKHYLGVEPNAYFFDNTSAFPLLIQNGVMPVARVALNYTDEGSMMFATEIPAGTQVSLSYAKTEYLLQESKDNAERMADFQPEALLLTACMNRRVFMGNEKACREEAYYANACREYHCVSGFGEILCTKDGGGQLNSSLLALGMRENAKDPEKEPCRIVDPDLTHQVQLVPLSDRLVTFLEASTEDLSSTVNDLERLAQYDPLTGLYNRHKMDQILSYELAKRRKEKDLSLLMFDIDTFKAVNDNWGREAGDEILRQLSATVKECIRDGDAFARWGGEEFLLLLTSAEIEQAYMVAERIRERVSSTVYEPCGHITISIGVTAVREGDSPRTIFVRADQALYDAKQKGRNCTSMR